ncbi:MAG TPA: hypothetical protein VL523_02835 [Terriglobia bacterium]|nr:hypothetical protein [Terriglobia bacterium]
MADRHSLSDDSLQGVKAAMKAARTADDLRRVLCVWLPAVLSLRNREVAAALGWRPSSVWEVQARYRREGLGGLEDHRQHPLPAGTEEAVAPEVKQAGSAEDLRRVLCVWLRARLGLDSKQVAAALRLPRGTVSSTQTAYLRSCRAAGRPMGVLRPGANAAQDPAAERLLAATGQARSVPEFRRALCVYLKAVLGLSTSLVAQILGWRESSVAHLHRRYRREGERALEGPGRGGARRPKNAPPEIAG